MKFLAVDWGRKRVGLAGSDSGLVAQPLEIVKSASGGDILTLLCERINFYQPETIIFGLPVDVNGQETEMALEVKKIVALIRKDQPARRIYLVNEFLTSVEAAQRSGRTRSEPNDDYAAAVILEQFFNRRKQGASQRS